MSLAVLRSIERDRMPMRLVARRAGSSVVLEVGTHHDVARWISWATDSRRQGEALYCIEADDGSVRELNGAAP